MVEVHKGVARQWNAARGCKRSGTAVGGALWQKGEGHWMQVSIGESDLSLGAVWQRVVRVEHCGSGHLAECVERPRPSQTQSGALWKQEACGSGRLPERELGSVGLWLSNGSGCLDRAAPDPASFGWM